MICRHTQQYDFIRTQQLADLLHVRPSSVTKMAGQLHAQGYIVYEKYGVIRPTEKGQATGAYLLYRHDILHQFLCMVNGTHDELEQVEQIEHYFTELTIRNLEKMLVICAQCKNRFEEQVTPDSSHEYQKRQRNEPVAFLT